MDEHGRPTPDAEQLLAVLDGVPVLLYVQDPDSRITYINRTAAAGNASAGVGTQAS